MWRKKNIISKSKILISHFTGKEKIITLSLIILMLSFANIISSLSNNSVSALSYQSEVGIGFTFSPTLSVSLSSSDLVISNLTPGNSSDSNSINASVATNASYGYTLSVNANSDYLTHSNNIDAFSSIATNADLSSLDDSEYNNIWGYSTSLDKGSTWSNYNGLSSSTSTTLIDNSNTADSTGSIDFKIGARAGSTQASGTYSNTITFAAVTKPTPMTLAEAYASEGKAMVNGFYTMQDMTSTICNKVEAIGSQLQVLDIRDYKVYWIAKLADNHCWMTQNLDLDLDSNRTYTHWDTDLGWSTENGNNIDENATWQPIRSTINFTIGSAISGWQNSNTEPYSANPGDIYFYTSNSDVNDIQYNSLQDCINAEHNDCAHYYAGNYYNWSATVASNDTSGIASGDALNSICPNNWELPNATDKDFDKLLLSQKIIDTIGQRTYSENGFYSIRTYPLYFIRSGYIAGFLYNYGNHGDYWSNTVTIGNSSNAYDMRILPNNIYTNYGYYIGRGSGFSVRCLAR